MTNFLMRSSGRQNQFHVKQNIPGHKSQGKTGRSAAHIFILHQWYTKELNQNNSQYKL